MWKLETNQSGGSVRQRVDLGFCIQFTVALNRMPLHNSEGNKGISTGLMSEYNAGILASHNLHQTGMSPKKETE